MASDQSQSLVDVPLLKQGEGSLSDIANSVRTLEDENIDIEKARREILHSPIYRDLLISQDGRTTAIQIILQDDPEYRQLHRQRNQLWVKRDAEGLTPKNSAY